MIQIQTQLNSIVHLLYVVSFLLGSNLTLGIMAVWLIGKKQNEDEEQDEIPDDGIDYPGVDESLSIARMRHPSGRMVLPKRAIRPSGTPESILDRRRETEDSP